MVFSPWSQVPDVDDLHPRQSPHEKPHRDIIGPLEDRRWRIISPLPQNSKVYKQVRASIP
jgi:hypothetical protein